MKKIISVMLMLVMIMSLACPAFAAEVNNNTNAIECPELGSEDDSGITPRASLSFNFSLNPQGIEVSDETYYVRNENSTLKIVNAAWNPPIVDVAIGWYNVETEIIYYVRYEGGAATNKRVSTEGVPEGMYRVVVMNIGDQAISGLLQYSVS